MGVPKFYRWISERYPCLSEVIREYQIPEFDNLYLDMNGIIHNCSHPNDDDIHFRITEAQIFNDVFRYIDFLFKMIKPRKLFFMAIDGVAPRAKMNQQRGRRFRSAKDAQKKENEARRKGETLPDEARFDSNCITPGTEFMDRLNQALKYFIVSKISSDALWQNVTVILSGHETPGEGEHKIMDYIRWAKSQPNWNPNTRHCLYGLDADLIVLGLASHEPYFSLLREEVKFLKPKSSSRMDSDKNKSKSDDPKSKENDSKPKNLPSARSVNPDVITFHLLHLSLMRDYLDLEFCELKETLSDFDYNLENIIDDWILMGFLVGNDFIPHLPHFHINKNSLTMLYSTYIKILPSLDGYLNENGILNLKRFEIFLSAVSEIDQDNFHDTYADLKYFESKCSISSKSKKVKNIDSKVFESFYDQSESEIVGEEINSANGKFSLIAHSDQDNNQKQDNNQLSSKSLNFAASSSGIKTVSQQLAASSSPDDNEDNDYVDDDEDIDLDNDLDEDDSGSDKGTFEEEFRLHKNHYYETKLDYEKVDAQVLKDQAEGYVRALQWNLHYYYNGCISWSWYYPHHYAPYISDVKNFASSVNLSFDKGTPFKPFEQLLAVLPAASKDLLPKAYQQLVTSSKSPLINNYPADFDLDMNEKQQDWEAVVKIPFIDEQELLKAANEASLLFSQSEKIRNRHGPHLLYRFVKDKIVDKYPSPFPAMFPDIINARAQCTLIDVDLYRIDPSKIKHGLSPGVKLPQHGIHFPGFPTLSFIEYSARLKKDKVRVFESASFNDNMILEIMPDKDLHQDKDSQQDKDLQSLALGFLGKTVFVNWPHMIESKIIKITDFTTLYQLSRLPDNSTSIKSTKLEHVQLQDIMSNFAIVSKCYKERKGINIGQTHVLMIAQPLTGKQYVPVIKDGVTVLELCKQWSNKPIYAPLQTIVSNVTPYDPGYETKMKSLVDIFEIGSKVFVLAPQYYGCPATVLEVTNSSKLDSKIDSKGSNIVSEKNKIDSDSSKLDSDEPQLIRVSILSSPSEPDMSEVKERETEVMKDEYDTNYVLAQKLGISGHVLSRFLGSIMMTRGGRGPKINLGLSLRFNARNEEIPGYSTKSNDVWLFSKKVLDIMSEYIARFPSVIQNVQANVNKDTFDEKDIFDDKNGSAKLPDVITWLKNLPCYRATRQKVGAAVLEPCVVKYVEKLLNTHLAMEEESKEVQLTLKPQLLYRPLHYMGHAMPDPSNHIFNLYDRVINVRDGISVPLGLKGIIIGIHEDSDNDQNTILDVLFDEEFPGGVALRCSNGRGYKMLPANLLNLQIGRSTKLKSKSNLDHLNRALQSASSASPYLKNQSSSPYLKNQSLSSSSYLKNQSSSSMNKRHDPRNFVSNHVLEQSSNMPPARRQRIALDLNGSNSVSRSSRTSSQQVRNVSPNKCSNSSSKFGNGQEFANNGQSSNLVAECSSNNAGQQILDSLTSKVNLPQPPVKGQKVDLLTMFVPSQVHNKNKGSSSNQNSNLKQNPNLNPPKVQNVPPKNFFEAVQGATSVKVVNQSAAKSKGSKVVSSGNMFVPTQVDRRDPRTKKSVPTSSAANHSSSSKVSTPPKMSILPRPKVEQVSSTSSNLNTPGKGVSMSGNDFMSLFSQSKDQAAAALAPVPTQAAKSSSNKKRGRMAINLQD